MPIWLRLCGCEPDRPGGRTHNVLGKGGAGWTEPAAWSTYTISFERWGDCPASLLRGV
jgi:hypothetical protein